MGKIISKEDLGDRTKYIGASDTPAILGLDLYRTPYDVWLEKTGRIPPTDLTGNKAAEAGIILEPSVLDFAEQHIGKIMRKVEIPVDGLGFPLIVHLDGITVDSGDPVEAKTSGLFSPLAIEWGEDGTDEVPDYVAIQVQVQIAASKKNLGHIPAFLGGRGFSMFRLPSNKELQQIIMDSLGKFWIDCVQADTPPPNSVPSLAIAGRIRREPGSTIEIDQEVIDQYLTAGDLAKGAKNNFDAAKAVMLAFLGDAEAGLIDDVTRVTYFEQERKAYEVQASKFRVLRIKKMKRV